MKSTTMPKKFEVKNLLSEHSMLIFFMVILLVSVFFIPRFATVTNFFNVLSQISINALLATGMTFVILTGGIDLSVASVAALAGVVASVIIKQFPGISVESSILVATGTALVVGSLCGSITAYNVAKLRVPPFIATLAMMSIARGVAYIYTKSRPISGLPDNFNWFGNGSIGVVPVSVIVMVLVLGVAYIILAKTCYGRYVYAIGSNEEVSKLSGIEVIKVKASVYIICGILAALAGITLASRLQSGQPSAAPGYELNAIAAVAMGGTSMSGGRGGIRQTCLGLLIIGIINNALSLLGVDAYFQTVTMGAIILIAVISDKNKNT